MHLFITQLGYKSFARPAILTAFLGYIAVVVGLMYDLGLPWHIYHPLIHPQPTSVLFEVAMCVMIYLTVLLLEFSPVILEHKLFNGAILQTIHSLIKKFTIPLVIMGIVLSTLHQSSLGSLFLINPYRVHQLWYTPIIWVLFFISAVGLGLMMVVAESYFSSWYFNHKLKIEELSNLGKIASYVLLLYSALRLGDIVLRDKISLVYDGSWQGKIFLFEILFSAIVPGILLSINKISTSKSGLALCSFMTVFGMIGYRLDVSIVTFFRPDGSAYFPSWMEIFVSLGVVSGAMLVFIFFVENLKVYEDQHNNNEEKIVFNQFTNKSFLPFKSKKVRGYSLAFVLAATFTLAIFPYSRLFGDIDKTTKVNAVKNIGKNISINGKDLKEKKYGEMLLIDGNRDGRAVLFSHDYHIKKAGKDDSCKLCHHMNMPFDKNSSCTECHKDMYIPSDIFDHKFHIEKLDKNESCTKCHKDKNKLKTRKDSENCSSCHEKMFVKDSFVKIKKEKFNGFADSYMNAMHGLCVGCHTQIKNENKVDVDKKINECSKCHGDAAMINNLIKKEISIE